MDTMAAMAMGIANRGRPLMVFDWDLAARRIRESGAKMAAAWLDGDRDCTGGAIFRDGRPVTRDEEYTYLASTWAVPVLSLDGDVDPCFRMYADTPAEWGNPAKCSWPPSALAILNQT